MNTHNMQHARRDPLRAFSLIGMRWLLAAVTSCYAVQSPALSEQSSIAGYLLDQKCAASMKGDSAALDFAKQHTRNCALLPACRAKGYAVFAQGKFFDLDGNGNKQAEKIIRASKRERGFQVAVCGDIKGTSIKVTHITELSDTASSAN